jgi:sulfoxide reductase heme-binding subunit YedZ
MPRGWPIVGWAAIAVAAMIGVIVAVAGAGEDGIRMVIRATARSSVVLFTAAFAASSLSRAWPSEPTRWMLANRRYLGVSFAVSHLAHFLALLALAGWSFRGMAAAAGPVVGVLGGIAYVFLAAMVATSFDRTAAWLGPRRWSTLHTVGMYWFWGVFFVSFAPRSVRSPLYLPFALALLAALALRLRYRFAGALAARIPAR